jgi:hypothetical protein
MLQEITTIWFLALMALGLAAKKKKPVFGQLTLTGEMALDWLKPGSTIIAGKIMIGQQGAFPEYNIPDWAQERTSELGIIVHANEHLNPMLVTQKSVLKALEAKCCEWEEEGAKCYVEKKGSSQRAVLEFGEGQIELTFDRSKNGGKFAPYTMTITEK